MKLWNRKTSRPTELEWISEVLQNQKAHLSRPSGSLPSSGSPSPPPASPADQFREQLVGSAGVLHRMSGSAADLTTLIRADGCFSAFESWSSNDCLELNQNRIAFSETSHLLCPELFRHYSAYDACSLIRFGCCPWNRHWSSVWTQLKVSAPGRIWREFLFSRFDSLKTTNSFSSSCFFFVFLN